MFLWFHYYLAVICGFLYPKLSPQKGQEYWTKIKNFVAYFYDINKEIGYWKVKPVSGWEEWNNGIPLHHERQLSRFPSESKTVSIERFIQWGFNRGACISWRLNSNMPLWPI